MHFDVFNGDADGIIALLQLRLATPKSSTLITGVKRDISLLKQVDENIATSVTVLDISMEKNSEALTALLNNKIDVFYVDHHRSGDIPQSAFLKALINTEPNTCTSLLVNEYLEGKYCLWAIAAAFGDNMIDRANALATEMKLSQIQRLQLNKLGTYINYNGYGRTVDDLHFHPAELFQQLLRYPDPFLFIEDEASAFSVLENGFQQDMEKAQAAQVLFENKNLKALLLEDASWARRVSGVLGNELANESPNRAHLVLTKNENNTYTVSLRAPLTNKQGADSLCVQFPTGGGRAAAAGINALPEEMLGELYQRVAEYYL